MHFAKRLPYQILVLAAILAGCTSPRSVVKENQQARQKWVENTLHNLTLEEKIGQMVMSRAYGYYYSDRSDEYHRLENLIEKNKVGGLIFFQGDVYETKILIDRLRTLAKVPLLIGGDFEWGTAMRIRRGTRFPEAMALGATRDTMLAYRVGEVTAVEMRALGIQMDFAPVVDINRNPQNPVINTRSFGESPELVAAMSAAFVSGVQSQGILATAKHFPGHGDSDVDSHLSLPVVSHTREQLDQIDLVPYKTLIGRGIASVMVAHLEVPALDPHAVLPSSLSYNVISGLLKRDLGFEGLVVTDAMDMGALVNSFGPDSAAVRAVEAGVDILLVLPNEETGIHAIADAVRLGRIPEARVDQSVRKILSVKWSLGLTIGLKISSDSLCDHVETPEHLALAKQVARRSITVLKNDSLLPFSHFGTKKLFNVIVTDVENYRTEINRPNSQWTNEPAGDYFTAQLRRRYQNLVTLRLDPSSDEIDLHKLWMEGERADVILCTVFSKARSGSGQFGLPPMLINAIDSLSLHNKKTMIVAMGSPYVLSAFPKFDAYVCSYSDAEVTAEATVEALFGEIPLQGKLPVTIPGLFPFGTGLELPQSNIRRDQPELAGMVSDSLSRIDSIIQKAVKDSVFPGAQVLVGKAGAIVYNKAFGRFEYSPGSQPVNLSTMYDLASLTKVIATTSAVMRLYDEGKLHLDDRLVDYLPECANHGKGKITLTNLLLHNGGLLPFKRLYLSCSSVQQVLDSVYQTEMIYKTGDSTVYSDFDFILLGKIVEKIAKTTLDHYVDSVFFRPLGMTRTMYRPPTSLRNEIAPTEYDSVFRKQLIQGVVHDENAYILGGVSGHAGLFSSAEDLAIFIQMLMNGGTYNGVRYLQAETIRKFTTKQSLPGTRALGWDVKTVGGYSTAGSLFSEKSFGHTGFTGTSVWVDPERNVFVVFLTNRIYPTRTNTKIMKIRPMLHDAVIRAITNN
jgi:beta-N-acetylhexosaminidase